MLVRVYTCQNVKLFEITCRGSYHLGLNIGGVVDLNIHRHLYTCYI